ncbi:MAG: hypothetical protein R3E32_12625 [Chitinophagales bacterium]
MNNRTHKNSLGKADNNNFPNSKMPHQQNGNRFFKEVRDESDNSKNQITLSSFLHNKLPRKPISADLLSSIQNIIKTAEE